MNSKGEGRKGGLEPLAKCEYLFKVPAVWGQELKVPAVWRREFVSAPVFHQEVAWLHAPVPLRNGQFVEEFRIVNCPGCSILFYSLWLPLIS